MKEIVMNQEEKVGESAVTTVVPRPLNIHNLRVPPFFDVGWIKKLKDMNLRSSDVWIVSYPKSGNTWTAQIVRLILSKGEDDGLTIDYAVPWVEAFGVIRGTKYYVDVDKMTSPRAFKSHFPYEMMPCGLPSATLGKYIYVLRNPKDVVVSYYHHYQKFKSDLLWDKFFELFMERNVEFGDYFDHVLSWWVHKDDKNVLIVKYEDMKINLPSAVAKVANFLCQDISQDLVDEIAHRTTFANMKKESTVYDKQKKHRISSFLRKGELGDWKNYFTPEQAARLDAVYNEKMKGTGIDVEFQ